MITNYVSIRKAPRKYGNKRPSVSKLPSQKLAEEPALASSVPTHCFRHAVMTTPHSSGMPPVRDPATASEDLGILRQFDLNSQYGPVSGLTRRERWERARELDLQPWQQVLSILNAHASGEMAIQWHIWHGLIDIDRTSQTEEEGRPLS